MGVILGLGLLACAVSGGGQPLEDKDVNGSCGMADCSLESLLQTEVTAEQLVHPELGVWAIFRPGATDAVQLLSGRDDEQLGAAYFDADANFAACEFQTGPATVDEEGCEYVESGCFVEQRYGQGGPGAYTAISDALLFLAEMEFSDLDPVALAKAKTVEPFVTTTMIDTANATTYEFAQIAGRWVLIAVDTTFGCSA